MRYVTFSPANQVPRLGVISGQTVVDLQAARDWAQSARGLPSQELASSVYELILSGPPGWQYTSYLLNILEGEDPVRLRSLSGAPVGYLLQAVNLLPPLVRPMSLRDFYAFEQHVATAHANRGKEVPPQWYKFPVFYFSNPNAIFGPDETVPYPSSTRALDYELEVACIIGRPGINLSPEMAEGHIFGYTIFNDWSARDVQREEMAVGLGPAKGKDFASSLGPTIVTPDELAPYSAGRPGVYDLEMVARINGQERSRGSWKELYFSFGEMIARASQDVYLLPGDVIGSGTVGTGCLLETTRGQGPWLKPGDVVELEIEALGILRNVVGGTP
jgi:fumarylacetoacetate (FAA) hydrolase